jgi:hypothetical protein
MWAVWLLIWCGSVRVLAGGRGWRSEAGVLSRAPTQVGVQATLPVVPVAPAAACLAHLGLGGLGGALLPSAANCGLTCGLSHTGRPCLSLVAWYGRCRVCVVCVCVSCVVCRVYACGVRVCLDECGASSGVVRGSRGRAGLIACGGRFLHSCVRVPRQSCNGVPRPGVCPVRLPGHRSPWGGCRRAARPLGPPILRACA